MFSFTVSSASLGLVFMLATATLATDTHTPQPFADERSGGEQEGAHDMPCGDLRCRIASEYCAIEHFAVATPARYSCRKLPRPECGNHALGGVCSGDAKTGYILEITYP